MAEKVSNTDTVKDLCTIDTIIRNNTSRSSKPDPYVPFEKLQEANKRQSTAINYNNVDILKIVRPSHKIRSS